MKKITCVLLALLSLVSFCACGDSAVETTEKTFDEKIQEIAYVADLKQYDPEAKEKVNILYSEFEKLSESKKENLTNRSLLYNAVSRVEVLTISEAATDLAIEHIKSDLLRPSSFELVNSIVLVRYEARDNNSVFYDGVTLSTNVISDVKVIIDYSAQVKAGGFDREEETVYYTICKFDANVVDCSQDYFKNHLSHEKYDIEFGRNDGVEYIIHNGVLIEIR